MKKHLITIVLLLVVACVQAQDIPSLFAKVNAFVTKQADFDTSMVYQPKPTLSFGLSGTGQRAGFDVDVEFLMQNGSFDPLEGLSSYKLSEGLNNKVGFDLGYGNIGFGYAFDVGRRSAEKKRSIGFDIMGKSWGVGIHYFKIDNHFTSSITLGHEEDYENYWHDEVVAEELATLKSLAIDGYYVFNNKRFSYPAAYKLGTVQRHTAGSWLLTGRYMQGSLFNTPEGAYDSYNLLDCYSTMQASIGGGYSANIVFWHHDPINNRDKGLRNITLNLTAMPVLTLYNYLKTNSYQYDEGGEYIGDNKTKLLCYPMPNYIGSAAICLSIDRFYFSTQFTYNRFYFRSRDAVNLNQMEIPEYIYDLSFRGIFHDWVLKGMVVYRL